MFSRKFVLTNCLAIATSMLAGCASYKNESGLPKESVRNFVSMG